MSRFIEWLVFPETETRRLVQAVLYWGSAGAGGYLLSKCFLM